MWFVVRFVELKSGIGLKEMVHLKTISVGVHLASWLRGCFVGNIPAAAQTSQNRPSSMYGMCGPYMECSLKTSCPERYKCIYLLLFIYVLLHIIIRAHSYLSSFAATKFRQHNALQRDGLIICIIHNITPECSYLQLGLPLLNKNLKI